ncbi:MAG: CDP-diacylglycerol--glycerol-3-phosphate 3-phosphatidyltransferase [Gemmatimonadota bacterium]
MSERSLTLPNLITGARIIAAPVVAWFAMAGGTGLRFAAFFLFLAAALSDLWDGYLARKHGWITDIGKLLDPLADKLLLAATLIPFYLISHRPGVENDVPFWGPFPFWALAVLLGREIFITGFRSYANRRGVVIAAGRSGKYKAFLQSLFAGALLLWYPLQQWAVGRGLSGPVWNAWSLFHRAFIAVTLAVALVLTVYSMLDYLWRYRSLFGFRS